MMELQKKASVGASTMSRRKGASMVAKSQEPRKTSSAARVETPAGVTSDERRRLIAESAFFRAERRAFQGGDPVKDWLEAEAEIDARIHRQAWERG